MRDGCMAHTGNWPRHWLDPVYDEDEGSDKHGDRLQHGIELLKSELVAFTLKHGIAVAATMCLGLSLCQSS